MNIRIRRFGSRHGMPLPLSDLVNPYVERLRQCYVICLLVGDQELTSRDDGELHADRVRRHDRFAEVLCPRLLMSFGLCPIKWFNSRRWRIRTAGDSVLPL